MRVFCILFFLCCIYGGCTNKPPGDGAALAKKVRTNNDNIRKDRTALGYGPDKLSDYGFFTGSLAALTPSENVLPYDINMPLFSDYAGKARFIAIPAGQKMSLNADGSIDFPIGTQLIKTFYYPAETPSGRKLLETRILERKQSEWTALTYIWNDEQTEAYLEVAGGNIDIEWKSEGVLKTVNYSVPNVNQCKTCHGRSNKIIPLGPKMAQLNKAFKYAEGTYNQLEYWKLKGVLNTESLPEELPTFPEWDQISSAAVNDAARAYLDANCGSCHHPEGSANTSGLFLTANTTEASQLGIMKKPVAAGKGSGGRLYGIQPGQPDESILLFRMQSTDPGVMMPELGRSLPDREGIELVRIWIQQMKVEQERM